MGQVRPGLGCLAGRTRVFLPPIMAESSQWPQHVLKRFEIVPPNPRDSDFYAPWNKLLNTLFPVDSDFTVADFTVAPQSYPLSSSRDSIDFAIEHTVLLGDAPVLVVETKEPGRIRHPSVRVDADRQIRERLMDLTPSCPLRTLRAFSTFGTSLAFYYRDKDGFTQPPAISRSQVYDTDMAPIEWWRYDVLEAQGAGLLREQVNIIKEECSKIAAWSVTRIMITWN
jgi:hypothetical protein